MLRPKLQICSGGKVAAPIDDLQTFDIYSLPKVPRQQPELLPDFGGLYFALDGAQRVWYVGQAASLKQRLTTHEKSSLFFCFASVEVGGIG